MRKSIKIIAAVITMAIILLCAESAYCKGPTIANIVGYEHRPNRATMDYTISVSGKITNTHSMGVFGKYRYNLVTDHAFQGLAGVFFKKTIDKVHSLNTSFAFVQTYGPRKSDSDRFSLSYNNKFYMGKKVRHKASATYSTETDFSSGRSVSAKNTTVIKTRNKKLTLGVAYGITYNLNNDHVTLHKVDGDIKYAVKKKRMLSFRYSFLQNSYRRTDADDIILIQYMIVL